MTILETIFSILAAIIVITIANMLVMKQSNRQKRREELHDEIEKSLEELSYFASSLLNEEPDDHTLSYYERRVNNLLDCLVLVKKPIYKEKNHHVKRKKDFTDD